MLGSLSFKSKQALGFSLLLFLLTLILSSALPLWFMLVISLGLGCYLYQNSTAKFQVSLLQANIAAALILIGLLANARNAGALNLMLQILLLAASCRLFVLKKPTEQQQLVWVQYFLIASCFILHQSMLMTFLIFGLIIINLYLHYHLFAPAKAKIQQRALLHSLIIIIPIWLGSFILFPRLAPFWQIPNANMATTGLSDSLDPGSIEQLVQNDSLAFRVEFDQQRPSQDKLYWRAKLYEHFDGRSWHIDEKTAQIQPLAKQPLLANLAEQSSSITYRIFAEPSQQQSVFALASPIQSQGPVQILSTGLVEADNIVSQRLRYQLTSIDNPITLLSAAERNRNLVITNENQQSHAFAKQLYKQNPSPVAFVKALEKHFNQQAYFYSLTPPKLGPNSIDQFLFASQTGFCSHYASASAFLLRSVGIAARVVGGYQGGNWYSEQNYLQVTQREAHAWVEYLDGNHWYRFDPTAAVAPERILEDLNAALSDDQQRLLLSGWQQLSWLNDMRQQFRHIDYYWTVWVLGFDSEQQMEIWQSLKRYIWHILISIVLLGITIIVLIFTLWQKKQRQSYAEATQLIHQQLPMLWQSKASSTSISCYLEQLCVEQPQHTELISPVIKLYNKALYQQDKAALLALGQYLRRNKKQLRRFFTMVQNT
ncbi:transglutaminaseTgpA domain-containing protein [Rheinheimera sp. WS51]|uniref:transglutaminase family protein n=1 Tax=Rheinheimera sp. WS51 TaxID=3425886 RepID=UPI003D926934